MSVAEGSDESPATAPPLVPPSSPGFADRAVRRVLGAVLWATLLVSPWPAAMLVRRVFAQGGARTKAVLDRHAPTDVEATRNIRYADEPDCLLDVSRPVGVRGPLPLVVWIHGGGWIGGSKDELFGYASLIAHAGYVVATVDYSRAPEHRYPTPVRQTMLAVEHLVHESSRYGIDAARIALCGDSAGAQIAAQLAVAVTTPGYARTLGIASTIEPEQLRALVLACGPYDLALSRTASTPAGRRLVAAVMWAYSGVRHPDDSPSFATWSVTDHLTAGFPAPLVTVGNADPLRPHSELLVARLRALGIEPDTLFWPDDHQPPLGHEYQFDLDTAEAREFADRLRAYLERRLA
jgi:acetyl esterase